jgi:transcriptional regulator with XRE-family HTH domain
MLKENINRRIANTKFEFNKSLFAREANLNRDEIVRILSGKIKNPGIYTIAKIANVLNCSVDDLLGANSARKDALHSDQAPFSKALFLNSVNYISNYIEQNKLNAVSTGKVLFALDFIYNFSYPKSVSDPDEAVASYVCNNSLK